MLGKLARWLRMTGYDTEYLNLDDSGLIKTAEKEKRVLLTRDRELSGRTENAILIRSISLKKQLKELSEKLGLSLEFPSEDLRCPLCNTELIKTGEKRWFCSKCKKEYWEGSHWKRIKETLRSV